MSNYYNNSSSAASAISAALAQKHQLQQQALKPSTTGSSQTAAASLAAAKAAAVAAANSISQQILQQQNQYHYSGYQTAAPVSHITTTYSTINAPASNNVSDAKLAQLNQEKEAEQKRLEEEMRKRRERIEKWRKEKNKNKQQAAEPVVTKPEVKSSWNLEDEDDDEEETELNLKRKQKEAEEEEEEDPLDAYMKEIYTKKRSTVKVAMPKKLKSESIKSESDTVKMDTEVKNEENPVPVPEVPQKKVMIMSGVAKKTDTSKQKGLIMEQDLDGLEYDSDEEAAKMSQRDSESLESLAANGVPKIKTKSEMVCTDHSKVYYRPFRKNFYVEVPEIAKMTQLELERYRLELEDIKVKGKNCPKPVRNWSQCGVSYKVSECLKKNLFEKPTPIQAQGIPIIMSGRDMIGIAKTGSGKTLAFLLPLFRHVLDQPELEADDGPIGIIMTPTRELAMQIAKEAKKFTKYLNINVVAIYGGTNISEQIAELKRGTEIIVCTPGRMIDMLAANNGRVTNLRRVTYVVLDEADRMFDMGFEPQVNKILENIRPDRQTVMFSATFPKKMEDLARKALIKPIEITIGGRSTVCKDVEQHVVVIEDDHKYLKLLELLGFFQESGSVIIFVDKQEDADDLVKNLLKNSYPCMALHGGVDQCDRESIIGFFKNQNMPLLVATSIAARGLDVKDLILVVNYDCPNHYEDYVHRCGRTGRAGNKGFAYTFITPEQRKYAGHLITALECSGTPVPDELKQMWEDYVKEMEAQGKKSKGVFWWVRGQGLQV